MMNKVTVGQTINDLHVEASVEGCFQDGQEVEEAAKALFRSLNAAESRALRLYHGFVGSPDQDCYLCGKPDHDPVHGGE